MKILSYNIYDGARPKGQDQTDAILDVINAQKPDLLGLCECTGFWDENAALLRHFENALGMKAVMNHAASGDNVALFHRETVSLVASDDSSTMMYHGFVRFVISLPTVGRLSIIMTHLHPTSFLFRAAEAQHILAKATFEPNAIVMGDLNSLAESDDLPSFALLSPNTRARLLNEEGTVRGSAVSIFLKHDFVDLGAERSSPTYPTRLFEKDTRDGIKLRLDYMLVTHRIAELAEFSTISNLKAQLASDHLPLLCKLRT